MYNSISQDGFVNAGACPSTHPVRMPQVSDLELFTRPGLLFCKAKG